MKKYLYFLVALVCSVGTTQAQEKITQRVNNENGSPKFISIQTSTSSKVSSNQMILDYVPHEQGDRYVKTRTESDKNGTGFEVFQHYYNDIKVEFSEYRVHSRNGSPVSLSGNKFFTSAAAKSPSLDEATALNAALKFVNAKQYKWETEGKAYEPKGQLVYVPNYFTQVGAERMRPVLAYKFDIYAATPVSRDHIYVDAKTGKIVLSNAIIKHAAALTPAPAEANGTGASRYSGTLNIKTDSYNGSYRLRDYSRGNGIETYDMNTSTNYNNAVDFVDNDNNWSAAEWNNAQKDNAAIDAHWGAQMTYDYFQQKHGRNSYNNAGATIKSYVHFDSNYDNAFWDGVRMTYGDGSGTYFDALTSLDVAAHEIGHAVCSSTANLVYQRESGALNEGYSDIWGAAVEAFAAPSKNEWLIGEDIERRAGHAALRSMSDPNSENQPDTYGGTYWQNPNCGTPTRNNDYCGVHTNSGVLNFWFYLTTVGGTGTNDIGNAYSVTAIGIEKAGAVAYRTESNYLSSSSTFADARLYSIQSAIDLYGAASQEEISVTNAWHAVGVGSAYSGGGNGGNCTATISTFPYSQSFESGIGQWSQASGDDFDWSRNSGGTPSSNTGPSSANDGTYYMYMESSSPNYSTKNSIFNSPCFDLSAETSATFSFKYHMYGSSSMGSLKLEAKTGSTWTQVWSASGNNGNAWLTATVDLASYAGSTVQLRFNGTTGTTWQGDMAVDKLSLTTGGGGTPTDTDVTLTLVLDNYASETSWTLKDNGGSTIGSGSNYSTNNATITENFSLAPGCYDFTINDTYGDGICCSYGNGSYDLSAGSTSLASGGAFTSTETKNFCVGGASFTPQTLVQSETTAEPIELSQVSLFPNPAQDILYLKQRAFKDGTFVIYNVSGKSVKTGKIASQEMEIDISTLEKGIYSIQLSNHLNNVVYKIVKQ